MRQTRDQFQQTAAEALHHEHLALLERGPAQVRRHVTDWTRPSRYACTVATRTLCPEVCRPIASTSAAAVSSDVQALLKKAEQKFTEAEAALQNKDLQGYADATAQARDLVAQALKEAAASSSKQKAKG